MTKEQFQEKARLLKNFLDEHLSGSDMAFAVVLEAKEIETTYNEFISNVPHNQAIAFIQDILNRAVKIIGRQN